jgi:RNA 2',3'-cyclic 3'-phosphodiesterase
LSVPRSKGNRARVFFALWPDDGVRDALAAAAIAAQARTGGRAIGADKVHLTLFFVGAIDRARIPALEAAAASMRSNAFELALDSLGYWRHNGIVWCGPARCPTALALLAADLRSALERQGVRTEERAYAPHITLVRDAARAPRDVVFAPCVWQARDFVLVESEPFEGGMRYAVRARWPL